MSQQQWGHGYHAGKHEGRFESFCEQGQIIYDRESESNRFLSQIEEQIKLLQQTQEIDSPIYFWCMTTLDIVNNAHRKLGCKYKNAEQIAEPDTKGAPRLV